MCGVVRPGGGSELLNRQSWRTNLELAIAMADYIEHLSTTRPGAIVRSGT
jgi:hypothetical protein